VEDTALDDKGKPWLVIKPNSSDSINLLLAKASGEAQLEQIGYQSAGRVFLFLETDDLARDYQNYTQLGVKFIRKPQKYDYGEAGVFEGLYGNLMDLTQYKK